MKAKLEVEDSLREFLEEMVIKLVKEYPDEIVSIALFGSAATGEWVKGKSDIDFIVVIADENRTETVENYTSKILLELDSKYQLELSSTCSTFARDKNPIVNVFYKIENLLMFGRPFFVFPLNRIRFQRGGIADNRIRLVTMLFDPLSIFLAKMKQTGVTIFGKNLIESIKFSNSKLDKARVALAPIWLLVMSLISLPVDQAFSFRHSMKATIWACEDALFALDIPLSNTTMEESEIASIFGRDKIVNLTHLRKTVELKRRMVPAEQISKNSVIKYTFDTMFFIFALYYSTAQHMRETGLVSNGFTTNDSLAGD